MNNLPLKAERFLNRTANSMFGKCAVIIDYYTQAGEGRMIINVRAEGKPVSVFRAVYHPLLFQTEDGLNFIAEDMRLVSSERIKMKNITIENLIGCARCGEDHTSLVFRAFTNPPMPETHFAICPRNGEPILLQITAGEEKPDMNIKPPDYVTIEHP